MFLRRAILQAVGRWAYKLEHLLPGRITHKLAGVLLQFRRRPGGGAHATAAACSALALSFPLWLSIALRHLGRHRGVRHRDAVHGVVSADRAADRRRVGADTRRRGRVRGGGADRPDVVLRRAERSRGGRGAGAARVSLLPTIALGFLF